MARLGGPVGGAAAFALTVGLAFDGGGYQPVSFDRALVGVSAAALLLVVLAGGSRPGPSVGRAARRARAPHRLDGALLALVGLSSGRARRSSACRGLSGRRGAGRPRGPACARSPGSSRGSRRVGRWRSRGTSGSGSRPTGPGARRCVATSASSPIPWATRTVSRSSPRSRSCWRSVSTAPPRSLLVPLAADIALQQSTGTVAALALGLVAYVVTSARPVRALALLVLPLAGALAVRSAGSVLHPPPTDLLSAGHTGHRLLLLLVLLMAAQGMLALSSRVLPSGSRLSSRRAGAVALAAALVALAVAPFAFGGHERGHYWRVAWHELAANPLLGSGAGTFADWWLRLRTVPQSTHEAHSLYLETLAELGPVGLALAVARARRRARRCLAPAPRASRPGAARGARHLLPRGRGRLPLGARGCHCAGDRARRSGDRARRRAAAVACASCMSFRRSPRSPSPASSHSPDRPHSTRAIRSARFASRRTRPRRGRRLPSSVVPVATRRERSVRTCTRSTSIRTTGARGTSSRLSREERRAASRWLRRRG